MRKIEVRRRGTTDPWGETLVHPNDVHSSLEWRYVGGVLEREDSMGWGIVAAQSLTVAEAQGTDPSTRFRLRPYDDAPTDNLTTWTGQCDNCFTAFSMRVPRGMQAHHQCHCGYTTMMPKPSAKEIRASHLDRVKAPPVVVPQDMPKHVEWLRAELAAAKGELAVVRVQRDRLREQRNGLDEERSRQGDEMGALRTENTQLLAENARLRRRAEDAERKAKVRR